MRRAALLSVLVLLAALVGPAAASPQPTPVCRFCGGQFESAAEEAGVNVTVARSDVLVQVHADGSATWTVTLDLETGGADLAAPPDRLEAVARSLLDDWHGLPETATLLDATVEDDRVELRYRDADAAARHAGLLVVDYLHDEGGQPWYHVNADRFVLRGPEGTVVANDPESGRVDGRTVAWRGNGTGAAYVGPDLEGSPYVVFGPDRTAATRLRAAAAVALATLPILVEGVRDFLLVQTTLFALLLAAVVVAFRRWSPRPRVRSLAAAVAVLGLVGIVVPVVRQSPGWITGPPLLGLGLAGLALHPVTRAWLDRPRRQALAVGGLLLAAYVALLGLHLGLANEWTNPALVAFRATATAFPLAAMVPLGGTLASRPGWPWRWTGLAIVGYVTVPLLVVNLADPPSGLGGGIAAIALTAAAVAGPLLGALGLALGWSLAGAGDATVGSGATR
ncbi:MAG: hypothetical protein ABEJ92_10400 [Halobacteriales archaeon]